MKHKYILVYHFCPSILHENVSLHPQEMRLTLIFSHRPYRLYIHVNYWWGEMRRSLKSEKNRSEELAFIFKNKK